MHSDKGETVISTTCCDHGCGGRCILKVHVRDGRIRRIETDDGPEPQLRACLRGRAYRQRVYATDRLKFPMKRVGARGEGKFARISWDEALDTVANELKRVKETYGPEAIMYVCHSGCTSMLASAPWGLEPVRRLLNMFGGCTEKAGYISLEANILASAATFGTIVTGNSQENLLHSRLIIMWGLNPADTIWSTNTTWYLARAREAGTRIVCVDPRYTDSATALAHEWIPIKPGTDTAVLVSMAHVMITEQLHDQKFLDTYTVGFDKFRDYVLGKEDGIAKTPAWAAAISGVPAATIQRLAREYATVKPAALMDSWAPGRSAYGEQFHRACMTLAAMTGNIGVLGGNAPGPSVALQPRMSVFQPKNPIERGVPALKDSFPTAGLNYSSVRVRAAKLFDAILNGKAGGYYADYKLVYVAGFNVINQNLNTNKGVEAFKKPEFVVVHEQFMTSTAKFADILLPVTTYMERQDIIFSFALLQPYLLCMNRAIDPLYESKTDLQICSELATRLGIANYNNKTDEEWLREFAKGCYYVPQSGLSSYHLTRDDYAKTDEERPRESEVKWYIPDYDTLKLRGRHMVESSEPLVAFKKQVEDPANNPFPTPSGKIEIYSQTMADMNNPRMPPIPKYLEPWEGPTDPLTQKYPLQLITTHIKRRAHSQFDNIPWLRELQRQVLLINSTDAETRGIKDGDLVRVFNDRGVIIIAAKVTERIMPGVVDVPQGAWYNPDNTGVDRGGCANVLTKDEYSPGGGFCNNTGLVQVEKV